MHRRVVVLLVALLVVAPAAQALSAPSRSGADRIRGVDLFRAIHFGTGPLVDVLPEFHGLYDNASATNDTARARGAQARLIGTIRREHPGFFDEYEAALTSGDHVRIDAMLTETASVLQEAVPATFPEVKVDDQQASAAACSIGVGVCVWTVVLAWNYAGAVNVAGAIFVWGAFWGPNAAATAQDGLARDQFVDHVATNLAA